MQKILKKSKEALKDSTNLLQVPKSTPKIPTAKLQTPNTPNQPTIPIQHQHAHDNSFAVHQTLNHTTIEKLIFKIRKPNFKSYPDRRSLIG